MPLPRCRRLHAAWCAAALLPFAAAAHGGGDETATGSPWALGLAAMSEVKPYRDFDNQTELWPVLSFENRWLRVFGPGVEFKLGSTGPASYGLTAGLSREGYKPADSPFLAGMARRKSGVWLGGRVGFRSELANLSAEWSADSAGHSQGQRFKLGVERRFALGSLGLSPRLGATWADRRFVQYYYGVEADEVRADRAAYRPGATVNTEVGLRLDLRVAPGQTVFADLGVTSLGSAIRNSPLVDRRTLPELRLGWLTRF